MLVGVVQPLLAVQIYGDAEAIDLVKSIKESSLYLGSAIATASATVLALMLTLLSVTSQVDTSFDRSTYKGIKLIGLISTVTFIGAVILLLGLSLPVGEFELIDDRWFMWMYYALSTLNGLLSAMTVIGVLVLFDTITTLIKRLAPDEDD